MTQRDKDLNIEVTPAVEDAFYFLRSTESEIPEPKEDEPVELYEARLDAMYENSAKAGERLAKIPYEVPNTELKELMEIYKTRNKESLLGNLEDKKLHKMIDNLKKYGVACAEWA